MKTWSTRTVSTGGVLLIAILIANVLNLFFNAYLGRQLSYTQFATFTLINTLWYLIAIFASALGTTVTHTIAFIGSKDGEKATVGYYNWLSKRVYLVSFAISLLYLASIPFISSFFNIQNKQIFILFTPVIVTACISNLNRGFLHGSFNFVSVASIVISEALAKVIIVFLIATYGNIDYAYLSIPLSVIFATFCSSILVYVKQKGVPVIKQKFTLQKRFFFAALVTGLSSNAFLTFDISLVKHFFPSEIAGHYALLSMVGKMIFFIGSLLSIFIIAFVSRDIGSNRSPHSTFYRLFTGILVLVCGMAGTFIFYGQTLLPIMFGNKIAVIFPYLVGYSITIAIYTLTHIIVYYHLALRQYVFSVVSILMSFAMAVGIFYWHSSINQVISVMFNVAVTNFIITIGLHFLQKNGGFFVRNVVDFISLALPIPDQPPQLPNGKRILIFNWRDTQHKFAGGAEEYLHQLAKRWVTEGNKVTLFCGNDGHCLRYEVVDGVEIIRRGGFYFVYVWAFFYYLFKFRGRYNTIIDSENGIPFFTPLYARGRIFLLIHHVHQEVFRKSLKPPFSWLASFLEIKFMPYIYKNIQLVTVSPSSKKEILKYGLTRKQPVIVYNGVDLTVMQPGEKSKTPLISYVGRLKYYKSLHIFIRAAKEILTTVPEARFVIAGDGEERDGLKRLVKKLKLEHHITFAGKITEAEKIELYRNSWVFVNPSFMEGWGITTIEANACGTPVVASDVPGLRDSVNDTISGFLAEYGNASDFAKKIAMLLQNEKLRTKMSDNALKWAQQFDWNKSAHNGLKALKIETGDDTKHTHRLNWDLSV